MNASHTPVILGADVSKAWLDIHVHGQIGATRIDNERRSIDTLLKRYRGAAIAIEATNRFHELLAERARQHGLVVYLVSGYELKHYAIAVRKRMRNDPIDAELLSRYLAHEREKLVPFEPRAPQVQAMWQLLKRRALLVRQHHQRCQSLSGVRVLEGITRSFARQHQRALALIDQKLKALSRELGWGNEVARLKQVKGIGALTAYALLIAYRSGRFVHHDAFVSYLGLDVRTKDSGKHVGRRKLTKRGDGEYRRLLHCAAMSAVQHQPYFVARYQALIARGLHKTAALVVIARKLARLAFALLHKQLTFDPKRLGVAAS